MRIGVDAFTLHPLKLDPIAMLDYAREKGLEGVQFGVLGDDPGRMREIRAHADRLGLYSHASINSPNPHLHSCGPAELGQKLQVEIERAAACGWRELHSTLGGPDNRYRHAVPWRQQLGMCRVEKEIGRVRG